MIDDARIAELTQKMLRKKLYVLLSKPLVAPGKAQAAPAGASRIHDRAGKTRSRVRVRAAGRRRRAAERTRLDGAAGGERRRKRARIAEGDPFFVNGLRTFELKEWTIMEGTLGLRVNLSDQSIEVA